MDLPTPPAVLSVDGLDETQRREFERMLAWLVIVPFTFPMWLSMRRTRPEIARRLALAGWLNVAASVSLVAIVVVGSSR